jgi:hypothetical protein
VELRDIEHPVANTAKDAVTKEVILFIGIERAGYDGAMNRVFQSAIEKIHDILPFSPGQRPLETGMRKNDIARYEFVDLVLLTSETDQIGLGNCLENGFRDVGEWPVTNIVEERGESNGWRVSIINFELPAHLTSDVKNAKCVIKSRVQGPRIHKRSHRKLADASEPL